MVLTRSKLWKTKNFWMQENQKKLAEALTDKIVKILKYGTEYTVITGEKKSKMQLIVVGKL